MSETAAEFRAMAKEQMVKLGKRVEIVLGRMASNPDAHMIYPKWDELQTLWNAVTGEEYVAQLTAKFNAKGGEPLSFEAAKEMCKEECVRLCPGVEAAWEANPKGCFGGMDLDGNGTLELEEFIDFSVYFAAMETHGTIMKESGFSDEALVEMLPIELK